MTQSGPCLQKAWGCGWLHTGSVCCLCLSALKCKHLLAHGGQSHSNSSKDSDRLAERFLFLKIYPCCLCKPHFLVPATLGYGANPHLQPLNAVGSHLSMLIAQRFKMLAVHIITSMVTKTSQRMRLKVQTPPVTCTSNHKIVILVLHWVLVNYVWGGALLQASQQLGEWVHIYCDGHGRGKLSYLCCGITLIVMEKEAPLDFKPLVTLTEGGRVEK